MGGVGWILHSDFIFIFPARLTDQQKQLLMILFPVNPKYARTQARKKGWSLKCDTLFCLRFANHTQKKSILGSSAPYASLPVGVLPSSFTGRPLQNWARALQKLKL